MILISHRGNINGQNPKKENSISYINTARNLGYFVEVDIWYEYGQWWTGHDEPKYRISPENIKREQLIFHTKNIDAFYLLLDRPRCHCFWHQKDDYTITSQKYIWVYPGKQLVPGSICVLPEKGYNGNLNSCSGICSDVIEEYKYYLTK